jgi:hypothetical protein
VRKKKGLLIEEESVRHDILALVYTAARIGGEYPTLWVRILKGVPGQRALSE